MTQMIKLSGQRAVAPSSSLYWFTMIILMSRMVWYDLRIVAAQGSVSFDITVAFTIWSIVLLPIFLWYIGQALVQQKIDIFPRMYLLLIVYSTVSGVILSNELNYVFAELVKYLIIPAMYLSTRQMIINRGCNYVVHNTFVIVSIFLVIRFFLYWYLSGSLDRIRYGGVQEIFALCVLASYWLVDRDRKRSFLGAIVFFAILAMVVIGEKRTSIAMSGVVVVICLFSVIFRNQYRKIFTLVYGLLAAVIIGVFSLWYFQIDILGSRAFTVTTAEMQNIEETRRALEIQYIYEDLSNNVWALLFGRGGGATFYLPFFYTKFIDDIIHSVHFTLGAMWFRHGIFGLFIYAFTFIYGMPISIKILITQKSPAKIAAIAFVVVSYKSISFFSSLTIFGGVDDALIGVLTAVAVYNAIEWNNLRTRVRPNKVWTPQ